MIRWQFGNGARLNQAIRRALDECLRHTNGIRQIIRLGSGNFTPQVMSWDPPVDSSKIQIDD